MRFTLRLESPTHVGSGNSLSWLDYFLAGPEVHVLDWNGILDAALLSDDDAAEKLAEFTDRSAKLIGEAQKSITKAPGRERSEILRRVRDQTSPVNFARESLKNDLLTRAMQAGDYDLYRSEFLGGRLDRRLEIVEQAKNEKREPTIPGSVLRGQIRTALMHSALTSVDDRMATRILEGDGGVGGWNRALADATPGRARFLFGEDLEGVVFRAPPPAGRPARVDGAFDLLRFVHVSEPVKTRASRVVLRASPFQFSRPSQRGEGTNSLPLSPLMMEAIDAGGEFEYDITVDTTLLRGVARASGGGHPLAQEPFWELFAKMFGVTRDEAKELEPAAFEARVISAIEVSMGARMVALLQRERLWCERIGVPKGRGPRAFLDDLEQASSERLPLRIGMGVGLHSVTAIAALESDASLAEPLGRALARAGIGLAPRERRERAEREKLSIERARKEAFGGGARLREDLLREARDPKGLPHARRFTMDGGAPDVMLGYATLAQGEMAAEAPPKKARAAQSQAEPERRERRPSGRRGDAPREKSRRAPVPDRPANESEIEALMRKFGPRR